MRISLLFLNSVFIVDLTRDLWFGNSARPYSYKYIHYIITRAIARFEENTCNIILDQKNVKIKTLLK